MAFQSWGFIALLLAVLGVCLPLGRRSLRLGMGTLTAACVVFYVAGGKGLPVLLVGMLVSYAAIRGMESAADPRRRQRVGLLAAGWHILVLLLFQYTGFFTGGAVKAPFVPLGLSFFTFQQLWLLREVWAGRFSLGGNEPGLRLALYSLFFPSVVSGPILKPQNFFPQLEEGRFLRPTQEDVAAGLYAIAVGTLKKVLLADSFGHIVNNGWSRLGELSAPAAWLVILGYTLQLYFDFSGYCDAAVGLGRLLGIRLPKNFDSPYRSLSVGEFWKRWHITLTSFLRECLYFPLGGSRKGTARTYLNILIIFLVSGFWHGAGWTFLIWGALHGLGQILERLWGSGRDKLPVLLRWCMTFAFVNLAWVFFRAPSVSEALQLLQTAVTGGFARPESWLMDGILSMESSFIHLVSPVLGTWCNMLWMVMLYGFGMLIALWPRNTMEQMETFRPTCWKAVLLGAGLVWCILSFSGISTFIYSNF